MRCVLCVNIGEGAKWLLFPVVFCIYHAHYLVVDTCQCAPCACEAEGWIVYDTGVFTLLSLSFGWLSMMYARNQESALSAGFAASCTMFVLEAVRMLYGLNGMNLLMDKITVLLLAVLAGALIYKSNE